MHERVRTLKILLELRPALDGHAGIPQETRLLFCRLLQLDGVQVEGLLQSSTRVLARGLPASAGPNGASAMPEDRRINRLSRVVVSLQQGSKVSLTERIGAALRMVVHPTTMLLWTLLGGRQRLSRFEAHHFKDFVWRALFAKTLPYEDFHAVTSAGYRVARIPWSAMHAGALLIRRLGHALYPRLDTRGFDFMIAETPYPGRMARGTKLVVRYHDAIPLLMPHTISDKSYHQASHYHALRRNVADGAWFACVSEATRRDLISVFPEVERRSVTIHNMVSHHFWVEDTSPDRIPEIIRTRRNNAVRLAGGAPVPVVDVRRGDGNFQYLLMVSTIEPRKNHLTLLAAWEQLRAENFPNLQLVFVGALGWDHKAIVKRFRPWLARGGLHMLEDVPAGELRKLYRHARATICPSFGEGFDFSGVEAMRCGSVVAASDIAVHRDIFGEAAQYFSAYSASELARAVLEIIGPSAQQRREELLQTGLEVSSRYLAERVLPQWQDFLARLQVET
jgi:glycosyltransferase involved in cell wall biosynthesis